MSANGEINWGPVQGGFLFAVLGGWLLWLITDSPTSKIESREIVALAEPSTPIDLTGFNDFLEVILRVGAIAILLWLTYQAYILFVRSILDPIRLSHEKINQIEEKLEVAGKNHHESMWWLKDQLNDVQEKSARHKNFILGLSKFSGYEGYLASQKAMEEMVGSEEGSDE